MATSAEIIAVGTEILLGQIVNTNAQFLGQQLAELGINVFFSSVVGDNELRIKHQVLTALERSDIVILCGGLGPTEDDVTREAVAKALNRSLVLQDGTRRVLEAQFAGREMPDNNLRQACVPEGADVLPNPLGTAPGLSLNVDGKLVFLLPGPPRELKPMFFAQVIPLLSSAGLLTGGIFHRTLRLAGIGESAVAQKLQDIIAIQSDPTIALYSRLGEVDVRLTTKAISREVALNQISALQQDIEIRLAPYVYGLDDDSLAGVLGKSLLSRGLILATAESCTGGMVGHLITNEPGSSQYYAGGLVCYSNESKADFLKVSRNTLDEFGAVSEPCVTEMLIGVLDRFSATVGVAISGIAGPGGATETKPVGTVYVAVGSRENHQVVRLALRGERIAIKERAAKETLRLLLNWTKDNYLK